MKRLVWSVSVLAGAALLIPARSTGAQGVTSAAVAGRVTDDAGAPVPAASVTLSNGSTGARYTTRSADDGRYSFENAQVGGPYVIDVHALGFEAARVGGLTLTLGQRVVRDFTLKRTAVEVAGVTVTAENDPLRSTSHTGAATFISDSALRNLPTTSRNFTDFLQTVPQVGSGNAIDGQNSKFNNIQIDGGANNDLFGLNPTPGGDENANPISIEAVKEYQVLIAPFDVRQGNFTGGLVNAVTKSGTNEFHGTAYTYFQNQSFVGTDTGGTNSTPIGVGTYNQEQFGFSLGGPIVRDKAHFFVATDFQHYAAPFTGTQLPATGFVPGLGISAGRADSVANILRTKYGFDPGTIDPPTILNPLQNVFGKVTAQLGTNSQLEVSENWVNSYRQALTRGFSSPQSYRPGYELSNSGWTYNNTTNTVRAKWTAQLGSKYASELLVGYSRIRDHRDFPNFVPQILVNGNLATTVIAAGADRFSQGNSLNQDIYEVTENLTFPRGSHLITLGTHNEFIHFVNVFFPESYGVWAFSSPDSLSTGLAYHYERAIPANPVLRPQGPVADWHVQQYGVYAEDQWAPTPRLTVTAGLRMDLPILDHPVMNPALDTTTGLKINTSDSPSGNMLWSPRLGVHYDVTGDATTILRGGVGIFSGRPPYVWMSNAFSNTGEEQVLLKCDAPNVPAFTPALINPANDPLTCNGGGTLTNLSRTINYFVPGIKFPQDLKVAVGADRRLPWGVVGTFDFLYTHSVNQFYFTDLNLVGLQGVATGEGGRPLYSTPSGGALPVQRISKAYGQVIVHTNDNRDRSFSFTEQFQKRFSDRLEFDVGYTYSHSEDVFSLTSFVASSNLNFAALDGTLDHRNLRTSRFDVPHKVSLSGTYHLPAQFSVSLIYLGFSGQPFGYSISGDANGDGIFGNDMVYVPRNVADITMCSRASSTAPCVVSPAAYGAYDAYIKGEDCLRLNRGRLLPRNSCRNPWQNLLNARVTKAIGTVNGQSVEITADMLNVLNFVNSSWGLQRETSTFETQFLLKLEGWDTANQRGIYSFLPQTQNLAQTGVGTSRWLLQVGLRYSL